MNTVKIVCHHPKGISTDNTFYVLSKGLNAGKPGLVPWINCFSITANDEAQRDMLFSICYSLHELGIFRRFLIGSVIPYIRVKEFTNLISDAFNIIGPIKDCYIYDVKKVKKIEDIIKNCDSQKKLLSTYKNAILFPYFKSMR